MSGKRRSGVQLIRENAHLEDEDNDEEIEKPQMASKEVMARRKIAQFKRRTQTNNAHPTTSTFGQSSNGFGFKFGDPSNSLTPSSSNPFQGFQTSTQSSTTSTPQNSFSMFKPTSTTPATNPIKSVNPITSSFGSEVPTSSSFSFTPKPNVNASQKLSKFRALNLNFQSSINSAFTKNPAADLSTLLKKYIDYASEINKDESQPSTNKLQIENKEHTPAPVGSEMEVDTTPDTKTSLSAKPPVVDQKMKGEGSDDESEESEDEDEPKKEITIQGPQFSLSTLPTSKNYGFKFGAKPKYEPDSDESEDEIKIEGPKFSLPTGTQIKDSVFTIGTKAKSENEKVSETLSTTEKEQPVTSAFSFGASTTKTEAPKFTFGVKPIEASKPTEESKPTTSLFSFSNSSNSAKSNPFSTSTTTATTTTTTPSADSTSKIPAFSFKSSADAIKKEDEKKEDEEPKKAIGFSFSKTTEESKSSKDESSSTTEPPAKSGFSGFNFGGNTSKPLFGGSDVKSAFTFSSDKKDDSKPAPTITTSAFSFSAPGATTTPAFGTSETPSSSSFNFSFKAAAPASTGGFSFSAPKPAEANTTSTSSNAGDDEKVEESEVKGDFSVIKLTEKIDVQTGEEDEEVIYQKRSKLLKLNTETKSYDSIGLGEVKILKNKKTQKFRILMRSEGANNILLNLLIQSQVKYETFGNGSMVRVPNFTTDGKIETYFIKVKTPKDGSDLLESIKKGQE